MNKCFRPLSPFKWFTLQTFPFIEDSIDALDEYQIFCKIVEKLNIIGVQVEEITNYFNNLDVQEEINNKLNEMAEDGTLQQIIENYLNSTALFCSNSVSELKTKNLLENSFAKTYGYYEANDGGGAFYIIKDSDEVADNGSVIELENGLKALLIVQNNTINYKMFGAKLNGVDSDSTAITNAHNFANENGYDIEQNGGIVKTDFTVNVKTNLKLNCNILLDDNTPDTVYNIVHDNMEQRIANLDLAPLFDITNNNVLLNKFCCPILDDSYSLLGKRKGSNTNYYHKQPIAIDSAGEILTANQFIEHSGTFELLGFSDLDEKGVIIEGGNIICNLSKIGFPTLFKVWRNNTIVKNFNIKIENFGNVSSGRYSYSLFMSYAGCNHTFENINGYNNATQDNDDFSYIFTAMYSWNVKLFNCNFMQGWGNIATDWVDGLTFENCSANRFDNHYGCFGNFTIRDCKLYGIGKIRIGYGTGLVLIDNLFMNRKNYNPVIETRDDFKIIYQGKITVKNIIAKNCKFTDLVYIVDQEEIENFPFIQPSVYVENIDIDSSRRICTSINSNDITVNVSHCNHIPIVLIGQILSYIDNCIINNNLTSEYRLFLKNCQVSTSNSSIVRLHAVGTEFRNPIEMSDLSFIIGCFFYGENLTVENTGESNTRIANCYAESEVTTTNCNIYNSTNIT